MFIDLFVDIDSVRIGTRKANTEVRYRYRNGHKSNKHEKRSQEHVGGGRGMEKKKRLQSKYVVYDSKWKYQKCDVVFWFVIFFSCLFGCYVLCAPDAIDVGIEQNSFFLSFWAITYS